MRDAITHAHLAFRRWLRDAKRLHMLQFRKNWALMRGEYECVGGPRDGEVVKCHSIGLTKNYTYAGVYRLEDDCRLHYHRPVVGRIRQETKSS